jgi:membrane-associated phospholipid phosphatase
MSALTAAPPARSPATADRTIGASLSLIATYLVLSLWPAMRDARATHDARALLVHVALLAAAAALAATTRPALRTLRDLVPLSVGAFLYVELRWLIPALGRPHADATVIGWERALFPTNPSATWAPSLPSLPVSEALHLAYASYYLLVLVPPVLLYLRGRRTEYARTMLALVLVYAVCFLTYLVFPVDGPRYLVGAAAAPEGPVRSLVLHLLAAGSSRGTAFPSSHVAASVVASLCALRFQRPVGLVVAVSTLGLALGTVYGGFHYAVDALAGVITGLAAWGLATVLWRALSTPGAQSASAAW